jgi:hypothetical protein
MHRGDRIRHQCFIDATLAASNLLGQSRRTALVAIPFDTNISSRKLLIEARYSGRLKLVADKFYWSDRLRLKQGLQKIGLPSTGSNGTVVEHSQLSQIALDVTRSPSVHVTPTFDFVRGLQF